MKFKALSLQYKEIDGRSVTGFPSIFGNVDSSGDRVVKGAFKKTLNEGARRAKHLWQHNFWDPPTAVIKELSEVGVRELPDEIRDRFPEATGGLKVVREYLNTPRAEEILEGIKSGAITEMSFAYDIVKSEADPKDTFQIFENYSVPVLNLKELKLWDTSDVVWGCNEATVASKSLELELKTMEDLLEQMESKTRHINIGVNATQIQSIVDRLESMKNMLASLSSRTAEPPKALTASIAKRLAIAERQLLALEV